jgi:hypothetical protein
MIDGFDSTMWDSINHLAGYQFGDVHHPHAHFLAASAYGQRALALLTR